MFEVMPGIWSVIVYVENLNTNVDATYVPYSFIIYDEQNNVIEDRKGATILPKNKTVGIFEGSIKVKGNTKPRRAVFELGKDIIWKKDAILSQKIEITNSSLMRLDSEPRVEAVVKNGSSKEIKNIELVAAIFDGADNVIAASRTFIGSLPKSANQNIFFTWPKPFALGTKACEKSSSVVLLLDRSGSMASLKSNPPEPLASAKAAAVSFVEQLKTKDQIGVISFANNSTDPIDFNLASDFGSAKTAIESINIEASSTQYTNIFEALRSGWQELVSARSKEGLSKIIVLLTDGVATSPKNPQGKTEAEDIKYAEDLALKEASDIKADGVIIYTIGLGDKINGAFLESVASKKDNYFYATSYENLKTIYKEISSDICEEVPARIEITYKVFGDAL
jgi:Mg-chelatase subunit ChlD